MGLFTSYLIYKYGRRRERRQIERDLEFETEPCDNCGYPRYMHSPDRQALCPNQRI